MHRDDADWHHCRAEHCREPGAAPCPRLLLLCAHLLPEKLCQNSCLKQEGGEEDPWRDEEVWRSCLFLGERSSLCCALLPRAGQRAWLFTAAICKSPLGCFVQNSFLLKGIALLCAWEAAWGPDPNVLSANVTAWLGRSVCV